MNSTSIVNIFNRLKKTRDALDKILEPIMVIMMALLVAAVAFQVFYRFVIVKFFTFSFPFTEEIATFLMVWSTYLAIAVCLKEGMHASVNILPDRLPYKQKLILYFILRILMIVFILFVMVYGIALVSHSFIFKSPTLRLPMAYIYLAPVVGSTLMLFEIIVEFLEVIINKTDPFKTITEGGL